jgi:PilZ domain
VAVQLELRLQRRAGTAVVARTVDVGPGGARVTSDRPLRVDEEFRFALPVDGRDVGGLARVLRQDRHDVYALRFEGLGTADAQQLDALVAARSA